MISLPPERFQIMPRSIAKPKQPHENSLQAIPACDVFSMTKADIAELSLSDIRRMNSEELIAVIRLAEVPLFGESVVEHLTYSDRATLEKLMFLARRTVQNQGY